MRYEVKWSEVAQSCLTLCDPMDCSLAGSSVHGVFQARILEWVAISFSKKWDIVMCNFFFIVSFNLLTNHKSNVSDMCPPITEVFCGGKIGWKLLKTALVSVYSTLLDFLEPRMDAVTVRTRSNTEAKERPSNTRLWQQPGEQLLPSHNSLFRTLPGRWAGMASGLN